MTPAILIGEPLIELRQVESTNNYATGLVHAGMARHGMAVFAHDQTAGKGQRTKAWVSEPGKNIAVSVIVQPGGLAFSQSFLFSMATAVGVQQFFSKFAGGDTKIKWPNDIYWRDRKAGGILIENILQGRLWKWAVVGIGININQTAFAGLTTKAVSLKQITGGDFDPLTLTKELCNQLQKTYADMLFSTNDLIAAYKSSLFQLNQAVWLKKESRVFRAVVKDVTLNGQLVVEGGTEEKFDVGEVEWLM